VRRTSRDGNGSGFKRLPQVELLKLQKSGQFPDESAKIKGAQAHSGGGPRYLQQQALNNNRWSYFLHGIAVLVHSVFIFSRIKKDEDQGKGSVTLKL
jgi:hypothetical protein